MSSQLKKSHSRKNIYYKMNINGKKRRSFHKDDHGGIKIKNIKIKKRSSMPARKNKNNEYKLNDFVRLTKNQFGIIKYIGKIHHKYMENNDIYYGIELINSGNDIKGHNSGILNGYKYFECNKHGMGIFIKKENILGHMTKQQKYVLLSKNMDSRKNNKKILKEKINELNPHELKLKLKDYIKNNPNIDLETINIIRNILK